MKKTILAILFIFFGIALGLLSYDYMKEHNWFTTETVVQPEEEAQEDPCCGFVFHSIEDAVLYQQNAIEEWTIDSIGRTIPPDKWQSVCTVLLHRDGVATPKSIVEEYLKNQLIYNTLAPPDNNSTESDVTTSVKSNSSKDDSSAPLEVRNKSEDLKDTVINGVTYKPNISK